jgi:hypothetical protein
MCPWGLEVEAGFVINAFDFARKADEDGSLAWILGVNHGKETDGYSREGKANSRENADFGRIERAFAVIAFFVINRAAERHECEN